MSSLSCVHPIFCDRNRPARRARRHSSRFEPHFCQGFPATTRWNVLSRARWHAPTPSARRGEPIHFCHLSLESSLLLQPAGSAFAIRSIRKCSGATIYLSRRSFNVGGTISIALTRPFLAILKRMRLLGVIVILGVLIWLGWSKPLKARFAEAKTTITSELNGLGKKPQKNHDSSGKRH